MSTIYVPYVGEEPNKLDPYWVGAKTTMTGACAEAHQVQKMLSETFGVVSFWETKEHHPSDVPEMFRPFLQEIFSASFIERHIVSYCPHPDECMDCNKTDCNGCPVNMRACRCEDEHCSVCVDWSQFQEDDDE